MRLSRPFLFAALFGLAAAGAQEPLPLDEYLHLVSDLPLPGPAPVAARAMNLTSPKIDPQLQRQVSAGARDLSLAPGLIPVRIATLRLSQVSQVETFIRSRNGEVTADFENSIWARIPTGAITSIASLAQVAAVSAQPVDNVMQDPPPDRNPRTMAPAGDGVRAAHLDALHQRGFSGKGVRIGILDRGFSGYDRLVREGRAKPARTQAAFPESYGIINREIHGSACAEILSIAAPGADLYLASFDGTQGQLLAAAKWLIAQGVSIINYSAGNVVNPNDGADEVSAFFDATSRSRGILWVVAAGNHAEQHWSGEVGPAAGDLLLDGQKGLAVKALTNSLRIVVRWNDWGSDPRAPSSTQDINAYLYALNERNELYQVEESVDPQNGGASRPVESIELSGRNLAGRQFFLVLRAKRLTHRVRVHVFLDPGGAGRLFPSVGEGSILNPASARSALAVGAVDVVTGRLASYSSQGPTDDGRLKPDVTAPSNTISWAYSAENGRFDGTSASAPHVAGFAALLKEMSPRLSPFDLRTRLLAAVTPAGARHPNVLFGYGEIDGRTVVPARNNRSPDVTPIDGSLEIPPEFGGTVSLRALAALRQMADQARDGLRVRVVSGRDLYRIGDGLRLGIRATGDCSCLLFVRDARGVYTLMPPDDAGYFSLHRGEDLVFPGAEGDSLEVSGPPGTDELLLVCASHPVPIEYLVARSKGAGLAVASHSYGIVPGNQ